MLTQWPLSTLLFQKFGKTKKRKQHFGYCWFWFHNAFVRPLLWPTTGLCCCWGYNNSQTFDLSAPVSDLNLTSFATKVNDRLVISWFLIDQYNCIDWTMEKFTTLIGCKNCTVSKIFFSLAVHGSMREEKSNKSCTFYLNSAMSNKMHFFSFLFGIRLALTILCYRP